MFIFILFSILFLKGQVNKILEERDVGSTATQSELTTQQVMAVQAHKQTDTSISKR